MMAFFKPPMEHLSGNVQRVCSNKSIICIQVSLTRLRPTLNAKSSRLTAKVEKIVAALMETPSPVRCFRSFSSTPTSDEVSHNHSAGSSVTVEHAPRAMAVVAPLKYPLSNPKDVVQVEYVTKAADKWLKSHPPPQGSALARPDRKPPTPRPFSLQTIALVILAYLLYRRKFFLG